MADPADPPGPLTSAIGQAVRAVALALAAIPAPAMIIGGIAVIARGVPRLTRDVDVTIAGDTITLPALIDTLRGCDLVPRIPDALAFAAANQVMLLTHVPSRVDVDLSIAWLPFENEALAAAERLSLGGAEVAVARAEDLIIYKAVAFRPQDQQDIERLLVLHRSNVDLARVRRVVGEFAAALDDTQRMDDLEKIIRHATNT
jgi:hypothetical protein